MKVFVCSDCICSIRYFRLSKGSCQRKKKKKKARDASLVGTKEASERLTDFGHFGGIPPGARSCAAVRDVHVRICCHAPG